MFDFSITAEDGNARTGLFTTPHGEIHTPVFMPVGTKASVKSLDYKDLENLRTEIILANTYHLEMRPGSDLIQKMGGLHKWMRWNKPVLTDSGGFQVFSLGKTNKISDDGVEFQSHINGDKYFFTPEYATQIQEKLGADIIMAFDECAPAGVDEKYAKQAMNRTHKWLERCVRSKTRSDQALFPIVQGGSFEQLRVESAKFASQFDLPGIAIGGVSVGESFEQKFSAIDAVLPHLPRQKPRYLMGVGTPDDLLNAVERGVDMFDCVLATRLARHSSFWTHTGRHDITNEKYKYDDSPLDPQVPHYASREFSKSYLRHLLIENEMLGIRLLTLHNIAFLFHLMDQIRYHIAQGSFKIFKSEFLAAFQSND
ncbi:tRNA guanosine(34) transglycosylase Tgt [Candidatus Peregrinibacteria bacterium]|nr:tRNA guanosine(34) transglycosylase Tgt [Candidatus Peregrinibacteria bacterium]